jgi:hexosaminidase
MILNDFRTCEPLKNYKRNGGGKKYRMHSPLTLFADACNSDAQLDFNLGSMRIAWIKQGE